MTGPTWSDEEKQIYLELERLEAVKNEKTEKAQTVYVEERAKAHEEFLDGLKHLYARAAKLGLFDAELDDSDNWPTGYGLNRFYRKVKWDGVEKG
jgi:hypothetical protein